MDPSFSYLGGFSSRRKGLQNTPGSEHFLKLRCRKSACRWGAKDIWKSRVQKTDGYGALLDVQISFRVAGARDCAPCQTWARREGLLQFQLQPPLHYTNYIPVHYIKLHYNYNYNYITLRYATLITLHYATLHSITLHYTTRHHTTLTTLITLTLH